MSSGASSWALPVVEYLWPSGAHLHPCSQCMGTSEEPMTSSRAMGQSLTDLGTNYLIRMHKAPGLTAVSSIPQGMHTYCTKEIRLERRLMSGLGQGLAISY